MPRDNAEGHPAYELHSATWFKQHRDAIRKSLEFMAAKHEAERDEGDHDPAEVAYWRFDAKRSGYAEWKLRPQSERDAFKQEYRMAVAVATLSQGDQKPD